MSCCHCPASGRAVPLAAYLASWLLPFQSTLLGASWLISGKYSLDPNTHFSEAAGVSRGPEHCGAHGLIVLSWPQFGHMGPLSLLRTYLGFPAPGVHAPG